MVWSVAERILDYPVEQVYDLLEDFVGLGEAIPSVDRIEYIGEQTRGLGTRTRWITGVGIPSKDGPVYEWTETVTAYKKNELMGFSMEFPGTPARGFLKVYPYDMGKKTFIIFAENHEYEGAKIDEVNKLMNGQLDFMAKRLSGELTGRDHKVRD